MIKKIPQDILSFLINNIPYAKIILSNLGIKQAISYGQRIGLLHFDHYTDTYWNDLDLVQKYINKQATGNENTIWQKDLLTRFSENIPFKKCLVIGCGNGWVERQLYDLKVGLNFDAFDISEKYLKEAKEKKDNRKICYFQNDFNDLKNLPQDHYDAIFNVGALHHGFRLSKTLWSLNKSLKSNGLMFNFDYVGPSKNIYSNTHFHLLKKFNNDLPKRFQTPHNLRPTKIDFAFGDSTEAVNADLIIPTFERFFDTVYQRNLNGGLGYQILVNNTDEFKKNDDDAKFYLQKILENDTKYTLEKKIPVLFWYGVGRPKKQKNISNNQFLDVQNS